MAAVAGLGTVAGVLVGTAPAASAAWQAPGFVRSIGGPASAQVYAWGADFNPVSNELLVSDYVNKTVRRYSPAGAYLGNTNGPTNVGLYAGIGVDPRDGSFYVGTQQGGSGRMLKFDATGDYMYSFDPPGLSPYPTVDEDGYLYLNQRTAGYRIDKLSVNDAAQSYSVVKSFSASGGTWYNDVAVASDGRVFAVQQDQYRVRVFDAAGNAIGQIGSKGPGEGKFNGDMRGVALDEAADRVYVVDSGANAVEVFTMTGSHVDTWGGTGDGPGQFQDGGRQVAVGSDGTVYVSDYGNFRVVPFSVSGDAGTPIPNPAADPDSRGFNYVLDVAWDATTGDIVTVDSYNQRFQRFSPTGELLDVRGRRGNGPPYGFNYPKGVDIDPATGEVWVVHDELGNPDITVYDTAGAFVREVEEPTRRRAVALHNGEAYILASGRINVRSMSSGSLLRSWSVPGGARNLGIDPATGSVYVPAGGSVAVYSGSGASQGTLSGGSSLYDAAVSGDVVYVTDATGNRVLAFDKATRALLGQFGTKGALPGQLSAPQGLDAASDGTLFITDRANGRVSVFSPAAPGTAGDTSAPTVAVTGPANNSTVPPGPSVVTGTAADAGSGIGGVDVAVKDLSTGLWWSGKSNTWVTAQQWNAAPVAGDLGSVTWRYVVAGSTWQRSYQVSARARDRGGLLSPAVRRTFSVGDPTPPETTLTTPAEGAVVDAGSITIGGQATDNLGVNDVEVSVQDTTSGAWWRPQTQTWDSGQVWFSAALANPGASATAWSTSVPATALGHGYAAQARSVDLVGKLDATPATVGFSVDGADRQAPVTDVMAVSRPGAPGTTVTISGTASDNLGVAGVTVAVQNVSTGKWLSPSGTFITARTDFDAALGSSSGDSVAWSFDRAFGNGSFRVEATSTDTSGNADPTPGTMTFLLNANGADVAVPTVTIASPSANGTIATAPTMTGTAADDLGLAKVEVSVKQTATGQWWDGSSWVAAQTWLLTGLDAAGSASTGWSLETTLPAGRYQLTARSTDVSNRVSQVKPTVTFDVIEATGEISVDRWDGVSPASLSSVPAGAPPSASFTADGAAGLSWSAGADQYAARMRVLVRPTESGAYTFWVAADDQATLRVGRATTDPGTMPTVARVPAYTAPGQWKKYAEQQSDPVYLQANTDYYVEAAFVEGGGGDFAEVAWQRDGTLTPQLIPADAFRAAGSVGAAGGWRAQVALAGGTATQSTTAHGGLPQRARDGNTSGSWGNGSVTHTDFQQWARWDLDLGAGNPIGEVQIWNRTDCCADRLSNVHVFVSASPFTSNDPAVVAATPGVQHVYLPGQLGVTTDVAFDGSAARYVRVQLDGSNALSLAEVKVFTP